MTALPEGFVVWACSVMFARGDTIENSLAIAGSEEAAIGAAMKEITEDGKYMTHHVVYYRPTQQETQT